MTTRRPAAQPLLPLTPEMSAANERTASPPPPARAASPPIGGLREIAAAITAEKAALRGQPQRPAQRH